MISAATGIITIWKASSLGGVVSAFVVSAFAVPALVQTAPAGDRSFGIGIDVLQEAFTYAARKIGYDPRLRLGRCGPSECRWAAADGVVLSARFHERMLGVCGLEAESARGATGAASLGFERACRTIVDLVQPEAAPSEQASIAAAITTATGDVDDMPAVEPGVGVRFFGSRAAGEGPRCGARAERIDTFEHP